MKIATCITWYIARIIFVLLCFPTQAQAASNLPLWHPSRFRGIHGRQRGTERLQDSSSANRDSSSSSNDVVHKVSTMGDVKTPETVPLPVTGRAPAAVANARLHLPVRRVENLPNSSAPEPYEACDRCYKCVDPGKTTSFEGSIKDVPPQFNSCAECTGCTHDLARINLSTEVMGKSVVMMSGNTGASIYTTAAPEVPHGIAVVKVHGVASDMVSASRVKMMMSHYPGKRHYKPGEKEAMASLMKISDECGLSHVNIREWVGPLRGVIPGLGERIEEREAIFAEYAAGASLEVLNQKLPLPDLLTLLGRLNHTTVHQSALFDLLFVQGDRHGENVFLETDGSMKLIDTRDTALTVLDSLFLPGTFILQRNLLGNDGVFERKPGPFKSHWPQLMLDYRCHVPGGKIGKRFPKQVQRCMKHFANSSANDLFKEYGMASKNHAARLRESAINLLTHGFEESIRLAPKRISYKNQPKEGYDPPPPCCRIPSKAGLHHSLFECISELLPDVHDDDFYYNPNAAPAPQHQPQHQPDPASAPLEAPPPAGGTGILSLFSSLSSKSAAPPAAGASAPAAAPDAQSAAPEADAQDVQSAAPEADAQDVQPAAPEANTPASSKETELVLVDQSGWGEKRVAAAEALPEIFAYLPKDFDDKYKNPCWEDRAGLHCLPYFHILGVSKCGTTDLYRRISLHHNVQKSSNKGPHFWDEKHSLQWYLDIYKSGQSGIESDPAHAVFGDASSNTLTYSGVGLQGKVASPSGQPWTISLPEVLFQAQPQVKLIAIFRNPVDRMYSAYYYYGHYAQKFGKNADGFHVYAKAMVDGFNSCAASAGMTNKVCATSKFSQYEQLIKGLYALFLADWLPVFPRSQMLFIKAEDYYKDVEGHMKQVVSHLGLEDATQDEWRAMIELEVANKRGANGVNRGSGEGDMHTHTRDMLQEFYQPFNDMLSDLLGNNMWSWA